MKIGTREFDFDLAGRTYIMGILNVTPDSFYDGGKWNRLDAAAAHTEQMIEAGADMIDIGGESTRPGYTQISEEEEIRRTIPVIEHLKKHFDIPVSIDTYKSRVARAAIEAGADLVNDIWGLKYDPDMAGVIAETGAACCLMHNRRDMYDKEFYQDLIPDMLEDLRGSVRLARQAGIGTDRIILDPGIGFAKRREDNLKVIQCLGEFQTLGFPILLGASRKSFIGQTLHEPPEGCMAGTLAVTVLAVMQHCQFIRVHDVKENVDAVRIAEAVLGTVNQ